MSGKTSLFQLLDIILNELNVKSYVLSSGVDENGRKIKVVYDCSGEIYFTIDGARREVSEEAKEKINGLHLSSL